MLSWQKSTMEKRVFGFQVNFFMSKNKLMCALKHLIFDVENSKFKFKRFMVG